LADEDQGSFRLLGVVGASRQEKQLLLWRDLI
jgi:hypothetical protein